VSKAVTIELPAAVLESVGIPEGEVRLEIALAFYKAGRLSLEKAAELAGLSVLLFKDASTGRRGGIPSGPEKAAEDSVVLARPPTSLLSADAPVVVGVDVGGLGKGFHAVALNKGVFNPQHFKNALEAYEWILEVKATVVAIDAPCRWAVSGKSRLAERELAIKGKTVQCFKTPPRTTAVGNPFYDWVFNGETLYELLSTSHDLFDGSGHSGNIVLETFPHAVACALAGSVIPANPKGFVRRRSLREQGFDVGSLANIDFVDAALCALTALQFHLGRTTAFGDSREGFIAVPQISTKSASSPV
jgi:predicted nuclease with RNAse H fold